MSFLITAGISLAIASLLLRLPGWLFYPVMIAWIAFWVWVLYYVFVVLW